jgi:hypothetical protein
MGRGHHGHKGHGGMGKSGKGYGHHNTLTTEDLEITSTDNGYEGTITGDSEDVILVATLDDVSGTEDEIIINLTQDDGSTQTIAGLSVEGVEDVNLNITVDDSNDTDDDVVISHLDMDSAVSLSIVSEESIDINGIHASDLEEIDLSGVTSGFTINHTHSSSDMNYIVDVIGDGTSTLNLDSDSDGTLDASVSEIELNFNVQDTITFSATSLESTLLVERMEVGEGEDILDLSALGVTSLDDLTLTDGSWTTYHCSESEDLEITSDLFEGSIILSGVISSDIDASNFIFA